jgi:hypothetical protein
MNIVIKNMRPTSIHLAPSSTEALDPQGEVKDVVPGIKLVPGANDVPAEIWEYNRKRRVVRQYLDAGYLKETKLKKAVNLAKSPKSLTVEEMLKHVGKITEETSYILDDWGKLDDRAPVRKAIEAKKKELERRGKKK